MKLENDYNMNLDVPTLQIASRIETYSRFIVDQSDKEKE